MNNVCKYCKNPIAESFYFCPNCGKKLKEPPFKFSWEKTIVVVLESILLPPLGLFPGIRHLRMKETGAKILGSAAILLTIISTIFAVIFFVNFINNFSKTYNSIYQSQGLINNPSGSTQNQVKQLQELGY